MVFSFLSITIDLHVSKPWPNPSSFIIYFEIQSPSSALAAKHRNQPGVSMLPCRQSSVDHVSKLTRRHLCSHRKLYCQRIPWSCPTTWCMQAGSCWPSLDQDTIYFPSHRAAGSGHPGGSMGPKSSHRDLLAVVPLELTVSHLRTQESSD